MMRPPLNVYDLDANDVNRIGNDLDDLIEGAVEALTSTPDYPALSMWDSHYVFVYDGMKDGFRRDRHFLSYQCLAVGWTKAHFRLWKSKGPNSYAVALLDADKSLTAPIYGEVYQVTPETIRELDWLHNNTFMTKRLRMPIDAIVDANGTSKQLYAWTYPHLNTYWHSRMDRLEPCDILTANSNGKKYYNYMKKYETISEAA